MCVLPAEVDASQPRPAKRLTQNDGTVHRRKSDSARRPISGPSAIILAQPLSQLTEKRVPIQSAPARTNTETRSGANQCAEVIQVMAMAGAWVHTGGQRGMSHAYRRTGPDQRGKMPLAGGKMPPAVTGRH